MLLGFGTGCCCIRPSLKKIECCTSENNYENRQAKYKFRRSAADNTTYAGNKGTIIQHLSKTVNASYVDLKRTGQEMFN